MAPKQPHFTPRAKNIIYLFMAGGPSQLELWDYKPKLAAMNGKPIPDSFLEGKRFAFMDCSPSRTITLLGTRRKFEQHGQSGAWVSEMFPHTAGIVDDIAIVKSCATNLVQPRAGEVVHEHRKRLVRQAEHGFVGHVRDRQRIARFAGLCRVAERAAGATRWAR